MHPNQLAPILNGFTGDRLSLLILFGSHARGEAETDSDIDVMVVLKRAFKIREETERISHKSAELCLENHELLFCQFMEESRYLHEQSPLLLNVRREGVPL